MKRTDHPSPGHSPALDDEHRDDVPALPPLPRPGVTARVIAQARATLATAERQIIRARGARRWRLTMRIDSARAVLRAGELAA